jgi:hypothetical protein
MTHLFKILICSFIFVSCATYETKVVSDQGESCQPSEMQQDRTVAAAGKCEDLFKPRIQLHEATLELITEVMPKSINDTFWKVVEQMSRNEDTKIKLETDKMVLTKQVNTNLKIHSTYVYEPTTDVFVLKKIEYTEKNRNTELLTSEPLHKESGQIRKDLSLKLSELAAGKHDRTIGIPGFIPHQVYKRVASEMNNLNLFTTHELLKISQLSPQNRMAKYQFMLGSRKVKSFIINDFMQELISKPIKTVVISVMSIAILSHTDFLKNVVSIKQETPEWVAPSVVKMAGRYPDSTQVEIVRLMKDINSQSKEGVKIFEKDFEAKKKFVNIDDVDQFTIQADPINQKTYFVLSHENQNGSMDIYSAEIDPAKYPQLSKRAESVSPDARAEK